MNLRKVLLPSLLALLVCACGPAPSDQAPAQDREPSTTSPGAPTGPQVQVPATKFIHADPATLADCKGGVVTLTWDVSESATRTKTIKIYTGNGQLFTHSGGTGSQDTGPWARPGTVFILKDATSDSELERLVLGGPVCP